MARIFMQEHYAKIAKTVREELESIDTEEHNGEDVMNGVSGLALLLLDMFIRDYPGFDQRAFLMTCGLCPTTKGVISIG